MMPADVMLRGAAVPGHGSCDVLISDGRIESVRAGGEPSSVPSTTESLDLTGYLLVPSAVEPHAHLDRALLGSRVVNPTGDLDGAVTAISSAYPSMTYTDIHDRARRALAIAVSRGYTAVRTHADCRSDFGVHGIRALVAVRDALAGLVDVQVVAMAGRPITGAAGSDNRRMLAEAIGLGADVVGGAPTLDAQPDRAVRELVRIASDAGRRLDVHIDETTDEDVLTVRTLASAVADHGLGGMATASHCVSLGQQDPATVGAIARELADVGVSVVTLPQTNLYLQGRDSPTAKPRGLTALAALRTAGVVVGAGGDNWRDPFNPLGRIDPFETAALLVAAGHLGIEEAYAAVTSTPRTILGLPPVAVAAGNPADLLAIRAASLTEAVADATEDRIVLRAGRVIARTTVTRQLPPALRAPPAAPGSGGPVSW